MKILNNLRLHLGIKNDVYSHFFIEVQWRVIPNVRC